MSMFEDISVIPVYQGIIRIHDSELNHCWDEQVYIGLSMSKCQKAIMASEQSEWPKTATAVGFIRFYQIRPSGMILDQKKTTPRDPKHLGMVG